MKIAIWGTKSEAIYLKKQLEKQCIEVICFVDNDKEKIGCVLENLQIISADKLQKEFEDEIDTVLLALKNGVSMQNIIDQLKKMNKFQVGLVKNGAYDFGEDFSIEKHVMWLKDVSKELFTYMQIVLLPTCNLNCSGCSHFANLFNISKYNNIYKLDEYKRDMTVLSDHADIFRLRLLGGEPLLHPDLDKIMEMTRKLFLNTDIRVVTNGLLLLSCDDKMLKSMHDNDIGLDISPYWPTLKIKAQILERLQRYGVKYCFEGKDVIDEFSKNIDIYGRSNPYNAMQSCLSGQCRTIWNGQLYKCPFAALGSKFFEYFDLEYEENESSYNIQSITDWKRVIVDLHKNPVKECKYCSQNIESFEWRISLKPSQDEWTVS